MGNLKILVVDDEDSIRTILKDRLQMHGYEVLTACDGEEALEKVEGASPELVLLDIKLPGLNGMEVLKRIKGAHPEIIVIMITAYMTVKRASEAMMEQGAYDFIEKPFSNLDLLMIKINRALERQARVKGSEYLRSELKGEYGEIIGESQEVMDVLNTIEKVAPSNLDVLITGESGTGKELVARAIHLNSSRRNKPFIAVNCPAIPETLIESELFGHERGAFSGATERRIGRFEEADGSTILLDEIGEMNPALQTRLLRVLQEREIRRIGGTSTIPVDVRVVASTNKDLEAAMEAGEFRDDLFYRLRGVKIAIPPLCERKKDIPILIEHFLGNAARNSRSVQISDDAMKRLVDYHWPGNVRELQKCIEEAVVLVDSNIIRPEDLPPEVKSSESTRTGTHASQGATLKEAEKELVLRTLKEEKGHRQRTADRLGKSVRWLLYKLKEYGYED